VSETAAAARTRVRRSPKKPPGRPPFCPWWLSGAFALLLVGFGIERTLEANWPWVAWDGFWAAVNGSQAIRRWQWDRYNRWKGGRS
jgi:hypothetical protein